MAKAGSANQGIFDLAGNCSTGAPSLQKKTVAQAFGLHDPFMSCVAQQT